MIEITTADHGENTAATTTITSAPDGNNTNETTSAAANPRRRRSTAETGHAKNVDNFRILRARVAAWGGAYNPPDARLSLVNLEKIEQHAESSLALINTLRPAFDTAIDERRILFARLESLVPRLVGIAEVYGATPEALGNLRQTSNVILGIRRAGEIGDDPDAVSGAHTSFANRLNNFSLFVEQYKALNIKPENDEFKVAALETLRDEMQAKHEAAIAADVPLRQARESRDKYLYAEPEGLVPVALAIKKFARYIFGKDSDQFREISNLLFRKR